MWRPPNIGSQGEKELVSVEWDKFLEFKFFRKIGGKLEIVPKSFSRDPSGKLCSVSPTLVGFWAFFPRKLGLTNSFNLLDSARDGKSVFCISSCGSGNDHRVEEYSLSAA